jgi:hypothetical protein
MKTRVPRSTVGAVIVIVACFACGDDAAPGLDGGRDAAAADVGPPDTGISCEPACGDDQRCCGSVSAPMCVDFLVDSVNCGGCDVVCAEGRGVECERGLCVCGFSKAGCAGSRQDYCCPPRVAGGMPYCADLDTDGQDCGECGAACDTARANECNGGRCVCGLGRDACDGTPTSACCADAAGEYSCTDTTTDRAHCGGCEQPCQIGESCETSTCRVGATRCPGGCPGGQVCCDGVCCDRVLCDRGECA